MAFAVFHILVGTFYLSLFFPPKCPRSDCSFIITNYIILSLMVGVFIDAFFKTSRKKANDAYKAMSNDNKRSSSAKRSKVCTEE